MKVGVVACTHGNLLGLQAVLHDAETRKADHLVAVGDFLGGHPDHAAVIQLLRDKAIPAVAGVLDEAAAGDLEDAKAMGDNPFSRAFLWAAEHLTDEEKDWLRGLPRTQVFEGEDFGKLVVTHNSPRKLDEKMDWTTAFTERAFREVFESAGASVIARANLHGQFAVARGGLTAVNVGTGGVPVDGDPRVGYALFETVTGGWRFELLRVAYDTEAAGKRLFDAHMPDAEARFHLTKTGKREW